MDFGEKGDRQNNNSRVMNKINLGFGTNSEGNFGTQGHIDNNSNGNLMIGADIDIESARLSNPESVLSVPKKKKKKKVKKTNVNEANNIEK